MSAAAQPRPISIQPVNLRRAQVRDSCSEFDLLVACCADASGRERAGRIRQIASGPLDWERVLQLAEHHRVIAQVYGQLSVLAELVPHQHLHALRSRYENNARKALWFSGELVRILTHLESAEIEALPVKGPALAAILYGKVTQREFRDLDVLIHRGDAAKAKAVLSELGYEVGIKLTQRQEQAYIRTGYEYSFSGARGDNLLELQWQILPPFYSVDFEVARLFERAEEVRLGGRPFRTLCVQDLLLVLCVHAAKHAWVELSLLCDIAQLAKDPRLDWDAVQEEAKRLGIERIISLNLLLVHRLLGPTRPYAIESQLREGHEVEGLADEVLRIIERSAHHDTESVPYFQLMMRLRERRRDQMHFLWRLLCTPSVGEWSAVRLPELFSPLYRVVRMFRLAKRLVAAG